MTTDENGPGGESGAADEVPGGRNVTTRVGDVPDPWATIRTGWARSGHTMPRPGSLAWCALPADDPVRAAASAAAELGVADELRRHGPTCARLLAEAPR